MKRASFLLLSLVIVALWVAGQAVYTAQTGQEKWPPQHPRAGTEKLYEDDRVIVWDDILSTEHYMHRHSRDSIYFYIEAGPVETMDENGSIRSPSGTGSDRPVRRLHRGGARPALGTVHRSE